MKFKILAGLALSTVALAACKVDVIDDGLGGFGGFGDDTTVTTGSTKTTGVTTTTTTTTTTNVTVTNSTTGVGPVCEDEATCLDCQNCAANGACSAEAAACQAGSPCLALNTCLGACPQDNPATADVDENLDCICTNDGMQCVQEQMAGTCLGDNPTGIDPFLAFSDCLFGADSMSGECGGNADCQQ